jgi:dTDP-4-dehydrorhamnose reductase
VTIPQNSVRKRDRILLIGWSGQIGWELHRTLSTLGEVVALDWPQIDLSNPDQIRERVRSVSPRLIVNAAAYTAVDQAESEPERAMAINGVAPGILAEEARRAGAALVHYSTDYVFDGTKTTPYNEDDPTNPRNVYGHTKLEGERAIQAVGSPHLILRTSWVYGMRGKNFLLTILRLAGEGNPLRIVSDQIGGPTWSRMVAEATSQILASSCSSSTDIVPGISRVSGLYHLTASGQTSWQGFAQAIVDRMPRAPGDPSAERAAIPKVAPISTGEYPTPAKRPAFSVLSNRRLQEIFGISLPPWIAQLDLCMETNSC